MALDRDFSEFIALLNANSVRYLVVGGYAVAFHGHPRYTKDLDIWVDTSVENSRNILSVLDQFGMGSLNLSETDFVESGNVIQLGHPPVRIDILTSCDGVDFAESFATKTVVRVDGLEINCIDLENLTKNKAALGRPQDLADISNLKTS